MKLKKIFILITILSLLLMLFTVSSCSKKDAGVQSEDQEISQGSASPGSEEGASEDEAEDSKELATEDDKETGEDKDSNGQEKEITQEETEEEIEIPEEITVKLKEADDLFAEGFYAEASKEYRNAQIAIEGSGLPEDTKQELLDLIRENYGNSNNIVDSARMHHSNAMNLIYEKRYEEAEAELIAALEIYPKYQTAIDALESLEDIKGLQ